MAAALEGSLSAVDEITLAHAALHAARNVSGVAGISRGHYAVARTFGVRGAVVDGVQFTASTSGLVVEVHLVVWLVPLPPLAAAVRVAVAETLEALGAEVAAVDVWIDALRIERPLEGCG